jgi:bifunctional UDP-N-acetylglucosamine pyrophosphorylase/glucosamine-1-phosphate N-acetyltransferase
MQGVILAAGKGKRLHPLTLQRSKAMAPVAGKPIVERVLEMLLDNGIRDFIFLVSPDDQELVPYFQQKQLDAEMRFITQTERLGMAHALRLAAPYLHGPFVMSACDNLTSSAHVGEMLATYGQGNVNAVLSLMAIDIAHAASTGIIEWHNGEIRRIVEKPKPEEAPSNISSLPLYLFSPHLLDYLAEIKLSARGEYELQDAIQLLIERRGHVTGVLTPSRVQLTTVADLLALNQHYLAQASDQVVIGTSSIGAGTTFVPPVRIEHNVSIGPHCVIGPNVYIEADCQIGANVQIHDALLLRRAVIADQQRITHDVVM